MPTLVVYSARNDGFDEYKMQSTTALSVKQIEPGTLTACAGMVIAPSKSKPRNLLNFKVKQKISDETTHAHAALVKNGRIAGSKTLKSIKN